MGPLKSNSAVGSLDSGATKTARQGDGVEAKDQNSEFIVSKLTICGKNLHIQHSYPFLSPFTSS